MVDAPTPLDEMPSVTAWLSDMDGVLVKENRALPGAQQFLDTLKRKEMPFLVLTNNSIFTNRDLSARLKRSGLSVPEERIWTSANATLTRAIRLIEAGAKFIATNPDVTGPSDEGTLPATGSVAAMIRAATGRTPYFIGKPNPVMIRAGLNKIGAHSEAAAMVGDRMDTDIQAGVEAGLRTHLVLSGSTTLEEVETFPFRPFGIHEGVGELIELVEAQR